MNWPSARSSRASAPFRTTNRAPDTFAARSKSMQAQRLADLEVLLGLEVEVFGGLPTVRTSLLSCSSAPSGTSARGMLGMTASASSQRLVGLPLSSSPACDVVLERRDLGHQRAAPASSFAPSPCRSPSTPRCGAPAPPAAPSAWRRASSSTISCGQLHIAGSASPRRFSPASNASHSHVST